MAKLLSSLPIGATVKDADTKYNGKAIIWRVMEHGHTGDPEGSTALVSDKIITLKCFDAMEPSSGNSDRRSYGNNRYLYSNLLQWLNSDAAAGSWYTAKHSTDAPPTNANVWSNYNEYDQEAGFLSNFGKNLKENLLSVTKKTAKCSYDGGSYEDVQSKVFLLSNTEVGLSNENGVAEGVMYEWFKTSSNRKAYPTPEAVSKSEYTSSSLASGSTWYWWLRSPYYSYADIARLVSTDGSLNGGSARNGDCGVRPACAVPSSISVSDAPDTDGAYVIQWNAAPIITVDNDNIGEKNVPFSVKYSITDPENDPVKAQVKLDETVVQTIETVSQDAQYTYFVDSTTLYGLDDGPHTITITATDSEDNSITKEIAFIKTVSPVTISGTDVEWGNVWMQPSYTYSVGNTDTSLPFTVTEKIDDDVSRVVTDASYGADIVADFSGFKNLSNDADHVLEIKAECQNGATAYRYLKFHKLGDEISFYTDAIKTDEAAGRIVAEINYSTEGNPEIKVEATNNACATIPVWEDMTEEFKNHTFHMFDNMPTDPNDFGVSVRVSLKKNANTERIYIYSLGLSFY